MGTLSRFLRQAVATASEPRRAIACNFIHDHRISSKRLRSFKKYVPPVIDESSIASALRLYHSEKVGTRKLPEFVYEAFNGKNILTGGQLSKHIVAKDVLLARIVVLNALGTVFDWAKAKGWRGFLTFPGSHSPSGVSDWLNCQIGGPSRAFGGSFISAILQAMNGYRLDRPYQPSWATTWRSLAAVANQDASRWLQIVGVSRPQPGQWCMLLRYSVREAGTIARPTCLDAGDYPFHFPSPPCAPLSVGGHPADLKRSRVVGVLPEYIHKQIDHTPAHVMAVERTGLGDCATLRVQRTNHHNRLVAYYGVSVLHWMAKPY
jgi:hypothetical protein